MDDAGGVRGTERLADVIGDPGSLVEGERALLAEDVFERAARCVLHDEIGDGCKYTRIVNGDGAAREGGNASGDLCLETEPVETHLDLVVIGDLGSVEELDGDRRGERRVRREPHASHRSSTEKLLESKALADHHADRQQIALRRLVHSG